VDVVAKELGILCYVTPRLEVLRSTCLDAGRISLCGEESSAPAATISAKRWPLGPCCSGCRSWRCAAVRLAELVGRALETASAGHYYSPHDRSHRQRQSPGLYEPPEGMLPLPGGGQLRRPQHHHTADDFTLYDPVDGSLTKRPGPAACLPKTGSRVVFRLSGTGPGATLRL